ncbi:MAG: hypothetical protein ACYCXX_02525 [Acidiferrobacter thiooxydans]
MKYLCLKNPREGASANRRLAINQGDSLGAGRLGDQGALPKIGNYHYVGCARKFFDRWDFRAIHGACLRS